MRRPIAAAAVALAALLWTSALIAAPAGASSASTIASATSALVYTAGSLVCHQRPERSFHSEGAQMPVCARCLGLYGGGVLGAFVWMIAAGFRRPHARVGRFRTSHGFRTMILIAAIPTLASIATAIGGWWDPENVVRSMLAVPLGAAIGACVSAVAAGDLR